MRRFVLLVFAALFVSCQEKEEELGQSPELPVVSPEIVEPRLTADDLARVLDLVWCEVVLPGEEEEEWAIGPVLEFGDGRKPYRAGSFSSSSIRGGTVVRMYALPEGEKLKVVVVGGGSSSSFRFNYPEGWGAGSTISLGGRMKLEEYLIKSSLVEGEGANSLPSLLPHQCGLRLRIRKVDQEGPKLEAK
ncbi:MAG: hypothetical protein AAF733_09300 [Verrucomicrobiota bacterium]